MKKINQAIQRRHEIARLDRGRAAVVNARVGGPRRDAGIPTRPHHRETAPGRRPNRLAGPRYVRDGNLITLVPASAGTSTRGEDRARRAA